MRMPNGPRRLRERRATDPRDVGFIGSVAPRGGGTLILSGSPRLLIQQAGRIPAGQRGESITTERDRFHRSPVADGAHGTGAVSG
jgi:hypothetical protein